MASLLLAISFATGCGGEKEGGPSAAPTQTKPAGYDSAKAACDQVPAIAAERQRIFDADAATNAFNDPDNQLPPVDTKPTKPIIEGTQVMFDEVAKAVASNPAYTDLGNAVASWKRIVDGGDVTVIIGGIADVERHCQASVPEFGFGQQ